MSVLVVLLAATLAGATASVAGFGIGSLLTPLLAIGCHSPPSFATTIKGRRIRSNQKQTASSLSLWETGRRSRGSGVMHLPWTVVAGNASTGLDKVRLGTPVAVVVSPFFGGVVGNQGGLRAGALLGLGLTSLAFVATSTMTGVIVDLARAPIYIARRGGDIAAAWPPVS